LPTYPVKNLKTGETKELEMSISQYEEWRKENSDWDKDWQAGVAGVGEVGEWKDKLNKSHPSWNTILDRAGKMPGSNVRRN
jgi:hypothetical protein